MLHDNLRLRQKDFDALVEQVAAAVKRDISDSALEHATAKRDKADSLSSIP
jgi:hypothetical protein